MKLERKTYLVRLLWAFAIGVMGLVLSLANEGAISQELGSKTPEKHYNRLILEKSPYLLQHADDPVNWYPWGQEAFEKARKENKLIFLSIGYSTCHWCHVMERESFENPEVARLMNETFVSIKVDREERPDIDSIYMTIYEMTMGSGAWPLSIIMTPDKKPFFARTYIPRETRFGIMGMLDLIPRLREDWITRQDEILDSANKITAIFQESLADEPGKELDESTLKFAYRLLFSRFDVDHGGFSIAPKFPTPHNLFFLLRFWKRTANEEALEMTEKTLQAMRSGGIYDHIGFGFHRYSTDSEWLVPHFEKMLYDQALLAMAYTEAYQVTGKQEYAKTAREILTYVLRDMTAPEGGFYTAEDAESEGKEGTFYLWTKEEIREVLGSAEADLITKVFNIEEDGNFTDEIAGKRTGRNILYLTQSSAQLGSDLKMSKQELHRHLEIARQKLFASRENRIHPSKDDKILADWNGLMIAALAKAAQVFDEPRYAEAAKRAVDFILGNMRTAEGRLFHRYRDGQAAILAYVDDYAFLIWGMLELYEATFEVSYLRTALELNTDLLEHFWDDDNGGFYFTSDEGESLLVRQKQIYDGSVPSGNSVAMLNLLRLGRMTANASLEEKAAAVGRAFSLEVSQFPMTHTQLMVGLDFGVGPSYEVVIAGNSQAEDTKEMLKAIRRQFIPNKVVILRPTEQESPEIDHLAEFTKYYRSIEGKATAYVCVNYNCKFPTTDIDKMLELLNAK